MAVGDIYQVSIKTELQGQQCFNVLNFEGTDIFLDRDDLASAIKTSYFILKNGLSVDLKFKEVRVKKIWPEAGDELIDSYANNSVGEGGAALPSFNAALVQLRTGVGGRSGRGRVYLPGLPEVSTTAGSLDSALQTFIVNWLVDMATRFIGEAVTSGFRWIVMSRKNFATTPGNKDSWRRYITSAVLVPPVSSMRSRKIGSGV